MRKIAADRTSLKLSSTARMNVTAKASSTDARDAIEQPVNHGERSPGNSPHQCRH